VEEAWRIVDPVLKAGTPVFEYEPKTWGPAEAGRSRLRAAGRTPWSPPDIRMNIQIFTDADAVAKMAAKFIAGEARAAVAARGRFIMAVSRRSHAVADARDLAGEAVPWAGVQVMQVDERIAPAGDSDAISRACARACCRTRPCGPTNLRHAVEEKDLDAAARSYADLLEQIAGSPRC